MALRWYSTVVESTDHKKLARWWAEALGWEVVLDLDSEVVVVPPWALELSGKLDFHQVPPGMVFVPVDHEKSGKNRLHWDFAPHTSDDRDEHHARWHLVEVQAAGELERPRGHDDHLRVQVEDDLPAQGLRPPAGQLPVVRGLHHVRVPAQRHRLHLSSRPMPPR